MPLAASVRAAVAWLAVAVLLTGCGNVTISTRTFGAATIDDLRAEEHYKDVYREQMGHIAEDLKPYQPSGANPGVCNVGGSAPGCIAADQQSVRDMQALIETLAATPVPPRFVEPDRLLRAAFSHQIEGLNLRIQALQQSDNDLWHLQASALPAAAAELQAAYLAFPEDNRPFPAP